MRNRGPSSTVVGMVRDFRMTFVESETYPVKLPLAVEHVQREREREIEFGRVYILASSPEIVIAPACMHPAGHRSYHRVCAGLRAGFYAFSLARARLPDPVIGGNTSPVLVSSLFPLRLIPYFPIDRPVFVAICNTLSGIRG